MVIKETRSDKIFNFINYFLLACVFLICLYPLWFIIIASISNPDLVNGGQVWFWPKDISFDGYKSLFADDGVMRGYVNTLIYTTGGTLINLAVTLPAAYALSRRDFVGRKFFTLMFLFTMFFSGGLIPTFLTVKSLGLYNNPWVMVILAPPA
ncbi:MAG: carbohydrate ABC transporter permease [Ruthenibacterium lactatiformans]